MDNNNNLHPLLRRAILFLENEEWGSADDYCERMLDEEPENAYAYVIKIMARVKVCREEDLGKTSKSFKDWNSFQNAYRFADPNLRARLEQYIANIDENISRLEAQKLAEEEEQRQIAKAATLNSIYLKASNCQEGRSIESLKSAIVLYREIIDYKDSRQKITECEELLKKEEENKRIREIEEKKREKQQKTKKYIVTGVILTIILIVSIIFISSTISSNKEKALIIQQNLCGKVFTGTDRDTVSSNGGGTITTINEITEYENKYTFNHDYTFDVKTTKRYAKGKYGFITVNGKMKWDDISKYSSSGTWGDVSVSFGGDITVIVDGNTCTLKVNSDNEPISITIDGTTYQ